MHTLERFLGSRLLDATAWVAKLDEGLKLKEANEEGCDDLVIGGVAWTLADCGGIVDVANVLANVVGIPAELGVDLDDTTCLKP